jgi:radical SAM protein with 4Fe4S-binding SPASM domain
MFRKIAPQIIAVELTLKCNMRCIHCGSSAGDIRKKELSSGEWIHFCKDAADLGCKVINLLGGEPLVRKEWYEISRNINDLGMRVSLITNGYTMNNETISQLRSIAPYTVAISIDGATSHTHDSIRQVNGSFERCRQALISLKEAGIPTTVITTVHKLNFKELPAMRDFLVGRGIAWQIQMADSMGRFPKQLHLSLDEFYSVALFIATTRNRYSVKEMPLTGAHCIGYNSRVLPNVTMSSKWRGCQAGVSVLGIESDGSVKGCLSLPKEFIEGNLRERPIDEIWNDPGAFPYNRKFNTDYLKDHCKGCKYGKTCKGGCLSVSLSETGNAHCDPYCFYRIEKEMIAR